MWFKKKKTSVTLELKWALGVGLIIENQGQVTAIMTKLFVFFASFMFYNFLEDFSVDNVNWKAAKKYTKES